jgi:hypothetical protein
MALLGRATHDFGDLNEVNPGSRDRQRQDVRAPIDHRNKHEPARRIGMTHHLFH